MVARNSRRDSVVFPRPISRTLLGRLEETSRRKVSIIIAEPIAFSSVGKDILCK